MKIKKDYEKSIDLLLEREGMEREEIDSKRRGGSGLDFSLSSSRDGSHLSGGGGETGRRRPSFKSIARVIGKVSKLKESRSGQDEMDAGNDSTTHSVSLSGNNHNNSSHSSCGGGVTDNSGVMAGSRSGGEDDVFGYETKKKDESQNSSFRKIAKSVGKMAKIFKKK